MGLNREKFRKIVGGITTGTEAQAESAEANLTSVATAVAEEHVAVATEQGAKFSEPIEPADQDKPGESRRFAKRGRPKGRKEDVTSSKTHKVKVSLFLDEKLINDLYDWAHADKIHPGEMFERALKPFHERETKRRNGGKA